MEMTIDNAIDRLEDLHFEQDDWEYGELTDDCLLNREALRLATDTMRKYQTIEEAYKKYLNDMVTNIYADGKFIKTLREVLENGNDD